MVFITLLQEDLPETVRQSKQRVLDMLVEEIGEREKTNREKKTNKRYKMVKFFGKIVHIVIIR